MEEPEGLEATPSEKRSARISNGEPEITVVTGCNGRCGLESRKQSASTVEAGRPTARNPASAGERTARRFCFNRQNPKARGYKS
jgi:hypothetical protein